MSSMSSTFKVVVQNTTYVCEYLPAEVALEWAYTLLTSVTAGIAGMKGSDSTKLSDISLADIGGALNAALFSFSKERFMELLRLFAAQAFIENGGKPKAMGLAIEDGEFVGRPGALMAFVVGCIKENFADFLSFAPVDGQKLQTAIRTALSRP